MKKDISIFLGHILETIERIENTLGYADKNKFSDDVDIQDAIIRRLEVIGEAAKNIPESFRNMYPLVQWAKIAGLRDKLIHFYFGVDLEKVWAVVKDDLSPLKKQIKEILAAEEKKKKPADKDES